MRRMSPKLMSKQSRKPGKQPVKIKMMYRLNKSSSTEVPQKFKNNTKQKKNYHMIQQFYVWGFIQKNTKTQTWKDLYTPMFIQHYLQQPRYVNNLSAHQWLNGYKNCDTHTHTHTQDGTHRVVFSHKKRMKLCHLRQHGWISLRELC